MILVPIESAYMRLPISPSLALWFYLAPFLRYGDLGLLAKNCLFFIPLSHSAPSLPMEFRREVNRQETRVIWDYPPVKTA